ncbi:uncharacterized protein LOC128723798 [Anopheles nili]|uniref:uncharacterized protein LOC128723798 n=1 Tax=Anopheles nili TaxID=185578 RepID=UPI00237B707F|nr:uncharacterized protein LOC128723798 [Anopheles nili]
MITASSGDGSYFGSSGVARRNRTSDGRPGWTNVVSGGTSQLSLQKVLMLAVLLWLNFLQIQLVTAALSKDASSASATSASASTSSSSTRSAAPAPASSLIDGIILDEDGVLPTLSEEAALHLLFQPRLLNFAERSIGDPHNQLVVLFNRHKNRSVYLGSISGSTAELSSSYFKEKVIPPGGNTSFNVVFLPRKLGPADGSLLIHTSFGMLRYQVQGEGIECPYRLRPLVGLQAPLNATITPEISIYNPHDTPLQIEEVYSSDGSFQLELPGGTQEGPLELWEIPPHSTRTVIRVRFHARTPGTHGSYVRIKVSGGTANPSLADKMLVVPVEVEITKDTGLYSRISFLELGVTSSFLFARRTSITSVLAAPVVGSESGLSLRLGPNVTRLSVDLLNSGIQPVRVKSWGVQADDMESVLCMHVMVAEERTLHVEFDWSKLTSSRRHISGRILLNLERTLSYPSYDDHQPSEEEEAEEDGYQQDEQEHNQDDPGTVNHSTSEEETSHQHRAGYEGDGEVDGDGAEKVVTSIYSIPFAGEVLKGGIQYNEEVLRFLLPPPVPGPGPQDTGDEWEIEEGSEESGSNRGRPLVIRNYFNVPLSITNISVPENCSRCLAFEGFRPVVLQPNNERTLMRIHRMRALSLRHMQPITISTSLRLVTNISVYELPVVGYSGRLERLLSPTVRDASQLTPMELTGVTGNQQELDFGVLPIATIGEALIVFRNPNPVPIPIIHWKGAITSEAAVGAPTITVILRGCGPQRLDGLVFCHTVQPGEWVVFQISVHSGTIDSYQGRFTVKTDYEEIVTPLRFTTAVGELHLMRERLRFTDCFPGKLCTLSLLAASSFPTKIQIESIRTDVPGLGYEFLTPDKQRPIAPNQPVTLHPDTVTSIGRLTFDPKAHCGPSDCYSSFDLLSKPFGVKWMATLDCYEQYRRLDSDKLLQQLQRYAEMRQRLTSVQFQVLAESSRRFDFNASVDLVWPKLLDENVFFPTLQVEQEAVRLITINNPSDQILFVHLVLHDVAVHGRLPVVDGGGGNGGIALPPEVLTACDNCSLSEESVFSFFLFDSDDIYVNYVKPLSFLRIAVKFSARQPGTYSTVLYMRNNLTLIDAAWIQARAVVPQFKFGNRRPGSPTALQFEITEKHLQPCLERYYRKLREQGRLGSKEGQEPTERVQQDGPAVQQDGEKEEFEVETKRTFTARNYGEVPIVISGIRIEEAPCEGYGFKVLDCVPFELAPNASRKIEIVFAPDFTLSRVVRMLHFDTNINNFPVNFTLLGTVPMQRLDICNQSLPRPWFEYWFRAFLFVVLPTALFGTLAAAVLDSNRVLRIHFLSLVREKGPLQPPLDLRQIALQHTSAVSDASTSSKDARTVASTSPNGAVNTASSVVSRNHRKPDRKNGSHTKGANVAGGLQNGSSFGGLAMLDSTPSRYNRSWNDFTTKLGASPKLGASVAVAALPLPTTAPVPTSSVTESSSSSQISLVKTRRSVTPPKEQQSPVAEPAHQSPISNGNLGATKDRTKPSLPPAEADTKSARSGSCGTKPAPVASLTSDLTFESNSTANKQHHHTSSSSSSSVAGTEEPAGEERNISSASSSLSSSSSSSAVSSTSSSPSPTTKQQHHQQQQQQQSKQQSANSAGKANVKKTKSLPVSYESVVVSLASVFAVNSLSAATTSTASYPSQKPTSEMVASSAAILSTSIVTSASKESSSTVQIASKDAPNKMRSPANNSNGSCGKQLAATNGAGKMSMATQSNRHQEPIVTKSNGDKVNFLVAGASLETLGKENTSSGNIIVLEKPTGGNTQSEPAQHQPQQSQSSKKFSKTPGRERKPNQGKKGANGKGSTSGGQVYKGTALQFNSSSQQQHKSTTLGTILQNAAVPVPTSVWGENCARFSDVVAQTPVSCAKAGGSSTAVTSTLLGMDLLVSLSALASGGNNTDQSVQNSRTLGNAFGTGMSGSHGNAHHRKPLHVVQEITNGSLGSSTDGGTASVSNRNDHKSKDDSYLGGTTVRETAAPYVATSVSPDLGPIGTSKKSPSGGSNDDGDGNDCNGTGRMACSRAGVNVTKCWEPFGGHILHNPTQLTGGSGEAIIGTSGNGVQQSDSLFSQSFADFHHHQNEQYQGIASMAGVSSNSVSGITTASLLSHPIHTYSDLAGALPNGSHHQVGASGSVGNEFIFEHSPSNAMSHQQHHHQRDWNNSMEPALHWSLSSHKPMLQQQSSAIGQNWNTSDLWNSLESQNQYPYHQHHPQHQSHHQQQQQQHQQQEQQQQHRQQQPQHHHHLQQQQQMSFSTSMHFNSQMAAAAATASQIAGNRPLQHQQQNVPDVGLLHSSLSVNDSWFNTSISSGQTTVAPPPGFSNHPPSLGSHAIMNDFASQTNGLEHYRLLLQLQQQRQPQHQEQLPLHHQRQQQHIRQLPSEDSVTGTGDVATTGPSSPGVPSSTTSALAAASSSESSTGFSASPLSSSSPTNVSGYDPFRVDMIWAPGSNSDPWAASAEKKK